MRLDSLHDASLSSLKASKSMRRLASQLSANGTFTHFDHVGAERAEEGLHKALKSVVEKRQSVLQRLCEVCPDCTPCQGRACKTTGRKSLGYSTALQQRVKETRQSQFVRSMLGDRRPVCPATGSRSVCTCGSCDTA